MVWHVETPEALQAFASRLAAFVSPVDFIALHGDLGAGKTTFAQGLVPALGISDLVTSPTYQIVHTHSSRTRVIYHCDFYRLGQFEEDEIGFREMSSTGIVLAEWPDAFRSVLPLDRLDVRIEESGGGRVISLTGSGLWERKLERFQEVSEFLDENGWGTSKCIAIPGDASARLFSRLELGGKTIMMMDWPPQPDGPPIRDGRPYCDFAHLAREGTSFIAVSNWLREKAGLSAPRIYASDRARGLYLVEDLGDGVFGTLIAEGEPLDPLYSFAVDGLLAIRASAPPQELPVGEGSVYRVPNFDREALEVELDLILQWYFKMLRGEPASDRLVRSFFEAWSPSLDWLKTQQSALILRDFHSPNLLRCDERTGLSRLGVVDFQDALWGHPAYDLVSLLQDARLDVPEASERFLYERYCEDAAKADPDFERVGFGKAYAILGAQRNTKILGIFARLSMRDGKHGYLAHLPRIERYLLRNLAHPDLKALRSWYEANLIEGSRMIRG